MNLDQIDILILDAHGVVFNNPFKSFLHDLAVMTEQKPQTVEARWYNELRLPAWTGELKDDEELWHRLTGHRGDPECWQALLETHYRLGPVAPRLSAWRQNIPIWILSNHRSVWLHRRLARFDLRKHFDKIIVSDEVALAKPDQRLFELVRQQAGHASRLHFVDDQMRNLKAARESGLTASHVDDLNHFEQTG